MLGICASRIQHCPTTDSTGLNCEASSRMFTPQDLRRQMQSTFEGKCRKSTQTSLWNQKLVHFHPQRQCKALQVVQRNVSCLTLNVSDECSMQSGFKRKRFLGPTLLTTKKDDVGGQQRACALGPWNSGCIHAGECEMVSLLSQPCLSHNFDNRSLPNVCDPHRLQAPTSAELEFHPMDVGRSCVALALVHRHFVHPSWK